MAVTSSLGESQSSLYLIRNRLIRKLTLSWATQLSNGTPKVRGLLNLAELQKVMYAGPAGNSGLRRLPLSALSLVPPRGWGDSFQHPSQHEGLLEASKPGYAGPISIDTQA